MSHQVPPAHDSAPRDRNALDRILALIQFWTFLSASILVAVTYLLWMPPHWSSFPQIPAVSFLVNAPAWLDYIALTGLMISLVLCIASNLSQLRSTNTSTGWVQFHKLFVFAVLVLGVVLVLLNQHRLQAWFYQLLIYCLVFLLGDCKQQLRWLRAVVISIYVYSALGKLDFEFAHTTGQELAAATFNLLGLDFNDYSEVDRLVIALALPLTELALGVLLLWGLFTSRSQRWIPGVLACGFHLLLSAILYWQLKHSWGVVLWNLQFAVQAILLFVLPISRFATGSNEAHPRHSQNVMGYSLRGVAKLLLMTAMIMPLAERLGHWDHWTSWALYAPHSSRVAVSVAPFASRQLPAELQEILPNTAGDAELPIPLSRWSLRSLGVPVYPQARFQLGVSRYLAEQLESRYSMSAEILASANRFTGERKSKLLRGLDSLRQSDRLFWLNTKPRSASRLASPPSQPTSLDQP